MQPSTFSTRLAACGGGEGGARPSELAAATQPAGAGAAAAAGQYLGHCKLVVGWQAKAAGGRNKQAHTVPLPTFCSVYPSTLMA